MAFFKSEKIKSSQGGNKGKIITAIMLIIVFGLIGGAIYLNSKIDLSNIGAYSCYWDYSAVSRDMRPVNLQPNDKVWVKIEPGMTSVQIGQKLKEAGLVEDPQYFACYLKRTGTGSSIQAGYFEITVPISIEKIVPVLQNAKVPTTRILVQEGLRIEEIAATIDTALLKDNPLKKFDKNEFISLTKDAETIKKYDYLKDKTSMEGFLFPDTYDVSKDITAAEMIDQMSKNFQNKVITQMATSLANTKYTLYEVITLASLVEKESSSKLEDRQMIADIIERRYRDGWYLGLDTTLLYENGDWKHEITIKDKVTNTPYNSFVRKGLPPTPICNPGIDTILATLSPKSNAYWYFLYGNDGLVRYGRTYDEHVQNINKYLR